MLRTGTSTRAQRTQPRFQRLEARIIRYDKNAAALPIPDEMLEAASRECDVVINGIAD